MPTQLRSIVQKLTNNLEILIVGFMVFVGPLVVNYEDLPKGYEVSKVFFLQICTLLLILVFSIKQVSNLFNSTKIKIEKSFIVLCIAILFILIASIFSPFNTYGSLDEYLKNIAWIGNPFRFQGAFTHILMVLFAYIIYKRTTRRNILIIFAALFLSSFVQSLVAIGQLNYFLANDFKVIFEGYYINGTFGQANFFSGRIMLGILASMFFISYGSTVLHNKKWHSSVFSFFLYVLLPLATLVLIIALVSSFSTWGIITTGILVLTVIIYEILNLLPLKNSSKVFGEVFGISLVVGFIAAIFILAQMYIDQIDNLRLHIWKNIYNISTSQPLPRVLIGYGYDTLGNVFKSFSIFTGLYVDRAHNFFLDILMQNGLISLASSLILIGISTVKFIFNKSSRILTYIFLGMFFWLFRSFVHESGIVNLYDFLILFAATFALQKELILNIPKFWVKKSVVS